MNKAIFLDRDGVLINNSKHYYIWKTNQAELIDGTIENLKSLIISGFQLFLVSNQGGISRGLYTKTDTHLIHNWLKQILFENQIEFSGILFCPHHPEIEQCLCRKPNSLMIDKLVARHRIDKDNSYFIGDSQTDMQAAQKAGIKGILTTPNKNIYPFISFLIK